MAIRFNFKPGVIKVVADFVKTTDAYTGPDANAYFNNEHNKALEKTTTLGSSRHEFETIYELLLDNFIEVDDAPEENVEPLKEAPNSAILEALKQLIRKFEKEE